MAEVATKFYEFDQNNSGGSFVIDDKAGLGPRVWIEAVDVGHAISRALDLGIYFDGIDAGLDCECCGDRWHQPWRTDGKSAVKLSREFDFTWHSTVYVHRIDGSIERRKSAA